MRPRSSSFMGCSGSRSFFPSTRTGSGPSRPILPGTRPCPSRPTRTGRGTRANRRCLTSRRWPASHSTTSSPQPPGLRSPWPSSEESRGRRPLASGTSGATARGRSSGFCSRSRFWQPSFSSRAASCRTSRPIGSSRRWKGRRRKSPRAPWRRRRPSRSSGPTAGGSSTPTPRTHTKTRHRAPTFSRSSSSFRSGPA